MCFHFSFSLSHKCIDSMKFVDWHRDTLSLHKTLIPTRILIFTRNSLISFQIMCANEYSINLNDCRGYNKNLNLRHGRSLLN